MPIKRNFRRYYIGLALPVLLTLAYLAFATVLLTRAGEYLPLSEIAERQRRDHGLFGQALYERTFWYKELFYRETKPEIATLGSSRVMQFRGENFSRPFYNLGSMHNMDDGIEMAHALFAENPPKILILGVDFWWFLPKNEGKTADRSPPDVHISTADLFKPPQWLLKGKMSFSDIGRILEGRSPDIGITALTRHDGFDIYGSRHYNAILTGLMDDYDVGFKESLRRIAKGEKFFAPAQKMSEDQWKNFSGLIDFLQQQNIHIVMFLPPFAPPVVDALAARGQDYSYITEVRQHLNTLAAQRKIPLFDFHDPRDIGADACEFVDGIHGGEILYNRLLLQMALKDAPLATALDLPKIGWNIEKFGGRASTLGDTEIDFLRINCKK